MFLPTFIILFTGAFVWVYSPSLVFVTWPSSIVRVFVLVFSPSSPSWVTLCSPGFKLSSNSIIVSNCTSTFSVIVWVPLFVPLPTLMIASSASTVVTVGSPSTSEFTIFQVVVLVPTLPGFTISYSPFLSVSTSLTSYLKGISSTCSTFPTKSLLPTSITAFSGFISSTLVSTILESFIV